MRDRLGTLLVWASGILVMGVLLAIISIVLIRGLPFLSLEFLTQAPQKMGREGGILPMIAGTFLLAMVAVPIATVLGVGAAIYLSEYTVEGRLTRIVRSGTEILAGVPSIIFGLFGFVLFVVTLGFGWSVVSGGLTVAFMTLPTIIRTSEESLRAVPRIYREVSYALGAGKWHTIRKVVLPSAGQGILTGVMLALGRSVAETAAVIFTAGSSLRFPTSPFDPVRTMAVHFYILAREGISMDRAYATAAALIVLILVVNSIALTLMRRYRARF
ncbi:MAG: phosphate ABC transporter permease PstA [Bacillota bacterium]|jgi:phosphate transport system permease protein|nr:phosphate ABC transporter permease PstA [Bacillota bacterium]